MSLYIALYQTNKAHIYHWALVAVPKDDLDGVVQQYQIRMADGPWEAGHGLVDPRENPTFVCCVALPPLQVTLDVATSIIAAEPVEQGTTTCIQYNQYWSCDQWVIRAISTLITKSCLRDEFFTRHSRWRELLYNDICKAGDEALANINAGTTLNGIRVLSLSQ